MKRVAGAEKLVFLLYLVCIVSLVSWHGPGLFAVLALLFVAFAPRTALRAAGAVLFFNLGVSLGYLLLTGLDGGWKDAHPWHYLALFNLRVFDVTFLTLYLVPKLNMARVLSFSPTLQFLYTAALSQIGVFTRTLEEFRLALRSRTVKPLRERNRYDFLRSTLHFFVRKSLHNANERTAALKARGFFDTTG